MVSGCLTLRVNFDQLKIALRRLLLAHDHHFKGKHTKGYLFNQIDFWHLKDLQAPHKNFTLSFPTNKAFFNRTTVLMGRIY